MKKYLSVLFLAVFVLVGVSYTHSVLADSSVSDNCLITKTLKKGNSDPQVKCLQRRLLINQNPKYDIAGISKGSEIVNFGPATESAVKDFQKANNLKSDGVLGPVSIRVLLGEDQIDTTPLVPVVKLFTNEKGKYSFEYLSTWKAIANKNVDGNSLFGPNVSDDTFFGLGGFGLGGVEIFKNQTSIDDWLKNVKADYSGKANIVVDGVSGIKIHHKSAVVSGEEVVLLKDGNIYNIFVNSDNAQDLTMFDSVVSSFKFISSTNVTTPLITVLSPIGGEKFSTSTTNQQIPVKWTSSGIVSKNVAILVKNISSGAETLQGIFPDNWSTNIYGISAGSYKIRICNAVLDPKSVGSGGVSYLQDCSSASSYSDIFTVSSPYALDVTLTATPSTITVGQPTTIEWKSSNATHCSKNGPNGWADSNNAPLSGSFTTQLLTNTTNFNITCTGAGGVVSKNVLVTVNKLIIPIPTPKPTPIPTVVPKTVIIAPVENVKPSFSVSINPSALVFTPGLTTEEKKSVTVSVVPDVGLSYTDINIDVDIDTLPAGVTVSGVGKVFTFTASSFASAFDKDVNFVVDIDGLGSLTKIIPFNLSRIKTTIQKVNMSVNALSALDDATTKSDVAENSQSNVATSTQLECKDFTIILKNGKTDPQVKCLQKMLNEKGFKVEGVEAGKETSFFGKATEAAVKAFQASNKLLVDGIFGPSSVEALKKLAQ